MPLRSFFLFLACSLGLFAQKKPITLDTVMQFSGGRSAGGGSPVWAPDGKRFAYIRGGQVMLYDVAAKQERELLSLDPLEKAAIAPPEPQRFDWQNRRVSENSFQWSESGKELLLSVRGDLFRFSLESGKWDQLTATPEPEHDPKLSPDGTRVAFRRGHDLYTLDLASRQVTRLTEDGNPTLLNGELDWVYPEELDLGTAFWWSPDSKQIAYLQLDVGREMVYPQVALTGLRAVPEPERYPQAGTANADVHIGVIPAAGGNTRWMELGETRGYLIARVYWTPDSSKLAVERFTRVQNQLDLMLADASS
jgi:dipeptidyl-peptidase-4